MLRSIAKQSGECVRVPEGDQRRTNIGLSFIHQNWYNTNMQYYCMKIK